MVNEKIWDCVIVGSGAAGLMTAIAAARAGAKTLILDGKEKVGAKILMSGGTRCNVTNQTVTENDFKSENLRAVRNVLRAFPSARAVEFFKDLDVELLLEPGGKYFPESHSAKTVLDALLNEAERLGVELHTHRKANEAAADAGNFRIAGKDFSYAAKTLVLATGGLSHPTTGSDGSGYGLALSLGHHLVGTTPALTPLLTNDSDWKSLAGITLPKVRLSLWINQKKDVSFEGGFLFTHFGFSGPAALNISRHWIHSKNKKEEVKITANFLPEHTEEELRKKIGSSKKTPKNFLAEFFPDRLAEVFVKKMGEKQQVLVRSIFDFPLEVTRLFGYEKAEVTAGGVDLNEVDTKTMESKIQPGLFFAGEILDADGRIGGFNFQWSWASGFLAGNAIAKKIK